MRSFRVSSVVARRPDAVWARATTIAGVNAELWPLARMTGEGEIREGALGRSWILSLGVLPIDYDDICLEAVEPGRGFRERSRIGVVLGLAPRPHARAAAGRRHPGDRRRSRSRRG